MRALRRRGTPRAVVIFHPLQYPVARAAVAAAGEGCELWYGRRVGRREAVGRQRNQRRVPPALALERGQGVRGDEGERRARGRLLVQLGQPRAHARARVARLLVAVPAPVPQLAALAGLRDGGAGDEVLQRVEDHDGAGGAAAAQGAHEPPPGRGAQRRRQRLGHAAVDPIGQARRIDRDDANGAQQVDGLVTQDEALQRAGEQQHAKRLGHGRGC